MTRDVLAEYKAAIGADTQFPAVRIEMIEGMAHMVCAEGHLWGSIRPLDGCPVCNRAESYRQRGRPECRQEGCRNIVECSDAAWERGVRDCRMHYEQGQIENHQTVGPICLDELVTVLAQYPPNVRWNGWICPKIDAWSVNKVLEAFGPHDEWHRFEWRADGALLHYDLQWADEPGFEPDIYEPDDDGLYALGAYSWTWSEDPEGVPHD